LILSGMEHTLQCLFNFLLITRFINWMDDKGARQQNFPAAILLWGALSVAIRFEGLFLVFVLFMVMLYYRRFAFAFLFGIVSVLPVVIFGVLSLAKGSFFLPNSVLLKSDPLQLSLRGLFSYFNQVFINKIFVGTSVITFLATQRLLLVLPLLLLLNRRVKDTWLNLGILVLLLTTLLHLAFASTGWFYRYEAYLLMLAVIFCGIEWAGIKQSFSGFLKWKKVVFVFALVVLLIPFVLRSMAAFTKAVQACVNIHEQQYQIARFASGFMQGQSIAANDIGAVSYYSESEIVDLWGLGSIEVARSRRNGTWNSTFIDSLVRSRKVGLIIIYDSWFVEKIPQQWIKLATWKIQNNVICGDDTVSFYTYDASAAGEIRKRLIHFQPDLPRTVEVKYY
jgi:hypothetical protein